MKYYPIYLFLLLFLSLSARAQYNYHSDTLYYNANWKEVSRQAAYYFRPPPAATGDLYRVMFYTVAPPHSLVSVGFHKEEKREGEWVFYEEGTDNITSRENYHEGLTHGTSTFYYPGTQQVRVVENYKRSKLHGAFVSYHPGGGKAISGFFMDGHPVGEIQYYYTDGALKGVIVYDSTGFTNKMTNYDSVTHHRVRETDNVRGDTILDGTYKYYHPESGLLKEIVTYKNDVWHGPYYSYDSISQKLAIVGQYKNNQMDGEWKYYHPNGALSSVTHIKDGYADGHAVFYNATGGTKLAEGYYKNGEKDDEWQYYTQAGDLRLVEQIKKGQLDGICREYDTLTHRLVKEGAYHNNKRKGVWKYYYPESGRLAYQETYKHDKLNGKAHAYDSLGNLVVETSFADGVKNGVEKYYRDDGSLWVLLHFKNGALDGKMQTFYRGGRLKREDVYENGALMSGKCLNEMGEEIDYYVFYQEASFGGDVMTYIGDNLHYPPEAEKNKVEGKVLVRFTIKKNGTLDNIEAIERIGSGCDEEAVRLVSRMPLWSPLYIDGEPFETQKTLPIVFWLK